ncbi:dockerin type I repeat-containing protein [Ruminococcus sp.]|uniref:dockerin type I repeat-containing protein n=1 Tax=Ruminococcus sp. TaxID=41978 RepID=UPI00388F473F
MFKKVLSALLAVMMVVSVMAVGVASAGAAVSDNFTPEANKLYFDVEGTGWEMGAKDKIGFYMVGGDFDTEENATKPLGWGAKKLLGKAVEGETGLFAIEPGALTDANGKNYVLTEGVQYKIIFARSVSNSWVNQTCPLYFTTDCLGHVAYSDGTEMENDVDSTKKSKAVYWSGIDPKENGPALVITSIGNVVGSCIEQGKTTYDLFETFISEEKDDFNGKTGLQNARYYTVEQAKTKTEQQMIDDIGTALGLTKDDVQKAFTDTAVETAWKYEDSTIVGPAPHEHTPGDPVAIEEGRVPAECEKAGSHVEVIYCSECGEEISRETVTDNALGHINPLLFVEEVPATATVDGVMAHYECTRCNKKFSDAQGQVEVTDADLVIKATHEQGDADASGAVDTTDVTVIQRVLAEIEVQSYDEVGADADGDEIVDIIDASLIQRVDAGMTDFAAWNAKHPNKWSAE